MIILKVIPYDNHSGLEATWLNQTKSPDIEIPAKEAMFDESGFIPAEPARTEPGTVAETQVWCQSYHPTQMQMFRDKAAEHGTPLNAHESLIATIKAAYVPPEPEPIQVPQVVTIRQGKLALLAAGLLDDVDSVVAQANRTTQIEWEYATELRRNWSTLQALQNALGLSDAQVDGLFIAAGRL